MPEPVVNIADVFPDACRVPAREVRVGDYVHDTFGRPDRVIRVSRPGTRRVTITPENLWPLVTGPDDMVTIRRGAS